MKAYPVISVIIPAYNEALRIGVHLEQINSYFKKKKISYEIVVVDDGSTDYTAELVRFYRKGNSRIRLLSYSGNRGKGYAVRYGMEKARGEYRLFTDADGSVNIHHLDTFLEVLDQGSDVVIGSIEIGGHNIEEHAAWYRRSMGKLAKILIRILATRHNHSHPPVSAPSFLRYRQHQMLSLPLPSKQRKYGHQGQISQRSVEIDRLQRSQFQIRPEQHMHHIPA